MISPHGATEKKRAFAKAESVVMLERFESTASDYAYVRQDTPRTTVDGAGASQDGLSIVQLDVSIRLGTLAVVAGLVVSVIAVLTIVFKSGVELTRFELSTKDAAAQTRLLDKYNSYTGNVSSMFGKPIEVFVAIAVQILLLRAFQSAMLQTRIGRRLDLLAFVLSAGVGYLINNGFNALNVQLRPLTIQPAMSLSELVHNPTFGMEDALARSSNVSATFSERSAKNPITNTALRNLVIPREPYGVPFCDWDLSTTTGFGDEDSVRFPWESRYSNDIDDVVSAMTAGDKMITASNFAVQYGFPQREWQSRLLKEAIKPQVLRVALKASNSTYTRPNNSDDLPMKASTAADLVLHMFKVLFTTFEGVQFRGFENGTQALRELEKSDSLARVLGFLPPRSVGANETRKREWFLNATMNATRDVVRRSRNISLSNAAIEFSHVEVSPAVAFDAITFDFEVNYVDKPNKTRTEWHEDLSMSMQCGPWPALCLVPKQRYGNEPAPQVQVYAACANSAGADEQTIVRNQSDVFVECDRISNTSLMVYSVGKRLVADALQQNLSRPRFREPEDSDIDASSTNLRTVYSLTVGKLSWQLSDLASNFNAKCSDGDGACQGIVFPLDSVATSSTQSHLVVGADALPMDLFFPVKLEEKPRHIPLVSIHEPHHYDEDDGPGGLYSFYDITAGHLLLPHNVMNMTWDNQHHPNRSGCVAYVEERIHQVLNNHLYIEHGLQTAYTAATFFLLQNGVVKDVVPLSTNRESLNFQLNVQEIAVVASVPSSNAWLTLVGCGVLVCSLCGAMAWNWVSARKDQLNSSSNSTLEVSAPHVVARVMFDSVHFPPMFLDRRARVAGAEDRENLPVDEFTIDSLALQWLPEHTKDLDHEESNQSTQV